MPEYLTLEEAARLLGMSPDELKAKAQHREIRALQDSGSWRFRKYDVEEEARRRGLGSDPELSLSDLEFPAAGDRPDSAEDLFTEFQLGTAAPDAAQGSVELKPDSGDRDILLDDRSVPMNASGSSSTIIGMTSSTGKSPSDSDVRLLPDDYKGASDSDVRLTGPALSDSDVTLVSDDYLGSSAEVRPIRDIDPHATMQHDAPSMPGGSSSEVRAAGSISDSDFELTPSSVIDALEPESGSDFELSALDVSSDEVPAARLRGPGDSDVTGAEPSTSGVNLGRPSDSGINLQSVGSFDMGESDSIELAPLDDDETPAAGPAKPTPKPAAAKPEPAKVDLSSTAVPMKAADKDIFEDTDFEVDAIDSDSGLDDQTVQLESPSDFDVDDDSSASEVFAIDEADVDQNAATSMAPAPTDDADDMGDSDSGEAEGAWDIDEPTPSQASRPVSPMMSSAGATPEWGGLWVGILSVATVLMLLLCFVGIDVVRNLYSFQSDGPASGLARTLAGLAGGG